MRIPSRTVSLGQMAKFVAELGSRANQTRAANAVVPVLAHAAGDRVSEAYKDMASEVNFTSIGSMFKVAGKLAGEVRPAREPHEPGETYRRLSEQVSAAPAPARGANTVASYMVGIMPGGYAPDPSPRFPNGTPLNIIDAGLNGPARTMAVDETLRSRAYSQMIIEGRAGSGSTPPSHHLPHKVLNPKTIIVDFPSRLIWQQVGWPIVYAWPRLEMEGRGVLGALLSIAAAKAGISFTPWRPPRNFTDRG